MFTPTPNPVLILPTPQQMTLFAETEPLPAARPAVLLGDSGPAKSTFCSLYCQGNIRPYRLTLFPGQDREWTDPEPHYCCDNCASKIIARGNRMILI